MAFMAFDAGKIIKDFALYACVGNKGRHVFSSCVARLSLGQNAIKVFFYKGNVLYGIKIFMGTISL